MTSSASLYSVCQYSTPHNDVWQDIEQTARTGGAGLGLAEHKIPKGEDARVRKAMAEHGLRATGLLPAPATPLWNPFFPDMDRDPAKILKGIVESIKRLAEFDPVCILIVPLSTEYQTTPEEMKHIRHALQVIDRTAGELGQRIAIERLGTWDTKMLRRSDDRWKTPELLTLSGLVGLIDELGLSNSGVFWDLGHSWPEEHAHEDLRKYIDRIEKVVHVNDVTPGDRGIFDRALPGEGRGLLSAFIATLLEAGYDGWWELEVFPDDGTYLSQMPNSLGTMPHEEMLQRAKDGFDRAFAEALQIVQSRRASAAS